MYTSAAATETNNNGKLVEKEFATVYRHKTACSKNLVGMCDVNERTWHSKAAAAAVNEYIIIMSHMHDFYCAYYNYDEV